MQARILRTIPNFFMVLLFALTALGARADVDADSGVNIRWVLSVCSQSLPVPTLGAFADNRSSS